MRPLRRSRNRHRRAQAACVPAATTPRNHRVGVTAARLIDRGATTLQITLVVIGVDYREERELLRLDGVSLNFLD
jgi:hypothetical protein